MAMFGDPEDFAMMSEREKYLYDLQGFLVVRNLLSAGEVRALNEALDANPDRTSEHGPGGALDGTPLAGPETQYVHYEGMLTWDRPWCQPFRDLLAHPKLIPYLNTMMGRGWKLDHNIDRAYLETRRPGHPFPREQHRHVRRVHLLHVRRRPDAQRTDRLPVLPDRRESRATAD